MCRLGTPLWVPVTRSVALFRSGLPLIVIPSFFLCIVTSQALDVIARVLFIEQ